MTHDPVPVLADRILALLQEESPNDLTAIGALAIALSILLREMHKKLPAPKDIVELADDLAQLAAEVSMVVQEDGTTIQ